MQRKRRWLVAAPLAAALAVLLAACSSAGLSDTSKQTAGTLSNQVAAGGGSITQAQATFAARLKQPDAAFMAAYADQVEAGKFAAAKAAQAKAAGLNQQLAALVKANRPEDQAKVNTLTSQIETQLAAAQTDWQQPARRIAGVISAKTNASQLATQAVAQVQTIDRNDEALTTAQAAATTKHPASTVSIQKHLATAHGWRTASDAQAKAISATLATPAPNYAMVMDDTTAIQATAKSSATQTSVLTSELAGLDDSEVRTLTDLKITCQIGIQRDSWDDSQDGNEHTYSYPNVMSTNTQVCTDWLNLDDNSSDGVFANVGADWLTNARGDFQLIAGFDPTAWNSLHFDPFTQWNNGGFFSGDSAADYWLNTITATYSVQFTPSVNGVVGRPYWQTVSPNTFSTLSNDLGMDVYEKAVGQFPDEANQVAAPAGMVYVGNTHYGAWHTDTTGQSFWAWYGQYSFFNQMLGGPLYRSQYNAWSTGYQGHKPYYGSVGGHQRFGTGASYIAASFPKSTYVKTGGLTAPAPATVRGAGAADRAKGPGGGGK